MNLNVAFAYTEADKPSFSGILKSLHHIEDARDSDSKSISDFAKDFCQAASPRWVQGLF